MSTPDPTEKRNYYWYHCFICGRDMQGQVVYHETESGRRICVDHLDDPAHYWTGQRPAGEERRDG